MSVPGTFLYFMSDKRVKLSGARLIEGQTHEFRILKKIFAEDGDGYFVVCDLWGYKILIPERYYTNYDFVPGQILSCRVDKVNCNGRMFIEPAHPVYREGESYFFPIESRGRDRNKAGSQEPYLLVRDVLGNICKVKPVHEDLWKSPPDKLECVIYRIKKGRPYLIIKTQRH